MVSRAFPDASGSVKAGMLGGNWSAPLESSDERLGQNSEVKRIL